MNVDMGTPQGWLTFGLFSAISQFERKNMLERQKVGIAAAKAKGLYKGGAPTAKEKAAKVLDRAAKGLSKQEIAKAVDVGVASVYRILADAKKATQATA